MTVPVAGRGPQVLGVAGLFVALTTIAICLRCYCRALVVKSFGLDDWCALAAWVLFVFFCTFAISGVHHGTGQHAVDIIPASEIPIGIKWWWACEPVYVLANMALKLSIGIFLLRIAVAKTHKIIIWTAVGLTEVYSAFFFFLFVLQCRPSSYFWTQYTGGTGSCIDPVITVDATYAYSAISCLVDWTLGLIPVFMIWDLQMNPRTKLTVGLILAVGAIASTATIVRIPYVTGLANVSDFLYATTDVAIWSTAETGIGITASSAATLRPLVRTWISRSKLMGGSTGRTGSNMWPKGDGVSKNNGYIRSKDNGNSAEEYGLRSDIGKNRGVTTVIESDDIERHAGSTKSDLSNRMKAEPAGPLSPVGGWNSEPKLGDVSSDEEWPSWRVQGIMKTTVTQVNR